MKFRFCPGPCCSGISRQSAGLFSHLWLSHLGRLPPEAPRCQNWRSPAGTTKLTLNNSQAKLKVRGGNSLHICCRNSASTESFPQSSADHPLLFEDDTRKAEQNDFGM